MDRWVEQWWLSGLTSLEFVKAEALPISARTLRSHGERHFGEVLRELHALRALSLANRPVSEVAAAPRCQVADSAPAPAADPERKTVEPMADRTPKAQPFFFDFSANDEPAEGGVEPAAENRQVANSENSHESLASDTSQFPEPVRHVANQQSSGPFLFEVEAW